MLFRTTDDTRWGGGKEARLTKVEIDRNFWELLERLLAVEQNAPQPANISEITLNGSQLTIYLSNGTQFGPYTLPVAVMHFRGDYAAATDYYHLDIINVPNSGLYLVLHDHTSVDFFDENAVGAEGALYHQIMPAGGGGGGGGISGVVDFDLGDSSFVLLTADHANKYVRVTTSSSFDAFTLAVPDDADVDMPIGTQIWIENNDPTRTLRIAGGDLSLVNGYNWDENYTIGDRYHVVLLTKVAANAWTLKLLQKPIRTSQAEGEKDLTVEYGNNRTLVLSDAGQYLRHWGSTDSALTIPPNSSVPFPLNTTIRHRTAAAGKVTLTAGAGVTLNPPFGRTLVTQGAGATIEMRQVLIDTWDISGDTEPVV